MSIGITTVQNIQLAYRQDSTLNNCSNHEYKHGITADSIRSLEDIRQIPFTTKADMRAHYPFGLVAGDMKNDGVRIHSSSGTTGNPTVIVHSQHDLDSWANLVARCLYMVGIRKTDVFQNSSGYGMFTGGLGFQYGAERLTRNPQLCHTLGRSIPGRGYGSGRHHPKNPCHRSRTAHR